MITYERFRRMGQAFCTHFHSRPYFLFGSSYKHCDDYRQAAAPTSAQPKCIAVAGDSTVFVVEIDTIEAFRSNQKLFEQNPSYKPSAVGARGSIVAIGGEVRDAFVFTWWIYLSLSG